MTWDVGIIDTWNTSHTCSSHLTVAATEGAADWENCSNGISIIHGDIRSSSVLLVTIVHLWIPACQELEAYLYSTSISFQQLTRDSRTRTSFGVCAYVSETNILAQSTKCYAFSNARLSYLRYFEKSLCIGQHRSLCEVYRHAGQMRIVTGSRLHTHFADNLRKNREKTRLCVVLVRGF